MLIVIEWGIINGHWVGY